MKKKGSGENRTTRQQKHAEKKVVKKKSDIKT